ncbi:hypothetical protein CRYPA_31 [uncultured Candidatus Thioglobus sp.]|nr:hypothetical protein CRYPA_31 [uncultured Candidatus Thioglobus sp.]
MFGEIMNKKQLAMLNIIATLDKKTSKKCGKIFIQNYN